MIHYHGGPITPLTAARDLWTRRHAFVSYAHPDQMALASEVCQSFALDNGAFTSWKQGQPFDFDGYVGWVREWDRHPAFDWCVIPDAIDGGEVANDVLLADWIKAGMKHGVPVWHIDEPLDRLARLLHTYPRVALGSAGPFATIGTAEWWARIGEAMAVACDAKGRPRRPLHGLRMLDPKVFGRVPLSSADSTNVARNIGYDVRWSGPYQPATPAMRALVMAERIELAASASSWSPQSTQTDFCLTHELETTND